MNHRHITRVSAIAATLWAASCASTDTIGAPETPERQTRQTVAAKDAAVTPATVEGAAAKQPRDAEIDLTPHGIAAKIQGPEHAKATAYPNGVELQSGDDYHLFVGRGVLDVLGEKDEIVKTYQRDFVGFLEDDGSTVVWETKAAGEKRFHFFASYERKNAGYHCRTAEDGAPTLDMVQAMLAACRDVNIVDSTTLDNAARDPGT